MAARAATDAIVDHVDLLNRLGEAQRAGGELLQAETTFKRLAALPQSRNLTLLALSLDAGFNSKPTFNAAFKKATGQTPSHYMKAIGQQV